MCWSFFLIKLQAWIIESLLWFTHVPCFHFRNNTQKNQLIRKYVTYLVKKHLNVRSIYYNVPFLIVKSFWNLSSLLHNLTYLSLLNSFLLLVLSTFHVFLKSLSNYFFQMARLQFSSCRILVLWKIILCGLPILVFSNNIQHLPFSTRGYFYYFFPLSNNIFNFSQIKCLA